MEVSFSGEETLKGGGNVRIMDSGLDFILFFIFIFISIYFLF